MVKPKRSIKIRGNYNDFANSLAALWGIDKKELENHDYNYKEYYNDDPSEAYAQLNKLRTNDPTAHFPDTYKLPTHPTFSVESEYSGKNGNVVGGTWKDNPSNIQRWTYQLSPSQRKNHWNVRRTLEYAGEAEDEGFKVIDDKGRYPVVNGIIQGGILPTIIVRPKYKEGGKSTNYVTTGGAGYVPPVIDANDVINNISNLWHYTKTYLKNKYNGTGDGTFIDLSNQNVSRIGSNTKGVKTILTNEFVERNKNTIRKKKDFINTTDSLLGDKKIPLSKISTYYGIENGKLKAGPLNIFNDDTTIVPNRAKYVGKIKELHSAKPESKEFRDAVTKGIEQYNKEHGYEADWLSKLLPFIPGNDPRAILYHNLIEEYGNNKDGRIKARNKRTEIINNLREKHSNLGAGELPYLVTENNDTIRGYELNASPKVMFANERGNAAFVSNIRNPDNINRLNKFLADNPSYPIMIDNGRYSSYMDEFPNAEVYGGLNRPDDMFIVGTTDKIKYKDGGSIHIAPFKRGTFTAAATKHGMSVQEFASRVLRNKDSYSPAMVKKANFARNASKWNH